jgi:nitrilase
MNSGADVAHNLARAAALLEEARAAGADVAVLPENFAFMGAHEADKLAVAELWERPTAATVAGMTRSSHTPIQDFLAATARRLSLWIVAGTVPLKTAEGRRVAAACLVYDAAGNRVARYDKMHLFDVDVPADERGRYRESASIAPGELAIRVVDSPAGKLGLSVCYDLRFPELFRELTRHGAEILCVPSAFTERTGAAHWDVLLRARAIENQCYVVAPGEWGEHPGGRRTYGHSAIFDPWGAALAQREGGEGVVVAPVPREPLLELRRRFPVLEHRRL